ncbi:MAG: TonB-dependent receptor [Pseudoxanthomonas sp.]
MQTTQEQPSPKDASKADARPTELDSVVVTAQLRSQSIMDVPISITAIEAEELEARHVQGVEDYIFSVPNTTFVDSGSYWGKTVSFRGISEFSGGIYEVVSVAVDDVGYGAINSSAILSSKLLDIDRIEVLRGPQGTLSGRNSMGGSINIITAKPDPERFLAEGTLDYGRFDASLAKAVVNLPFASGDAALRAAAYTEHSDGAIENVGPSGGGSGYDNNGARLALRWLPVEGLTINASLAHERQDRNMEDWITSTFTDDATRQAMVAALTSWGGSYPGPVDLFDDVGNNGGKVSKDVPERTLIDDWIGSFRASYDSGRHRFDFIYGYFDYDVAYREDYDQTEYNWWKTDRHRQVRNHSLELRATSQYDGPLNWVGGVSYLDERLSERNADEIGDWYADGTTPTVGGGYLPAYLEVYENRMQSLGVFGNVYWDFGQHWHLSAGGRYSMEKTRYGDDYVYDPGNTALAIGASPEMSPWATLNEFSPRIALNYDLGRNAMVYAQYATGYRAGYSNTAQARDLGAPSDVKPEHVKNYEIGFKGRFWDNRASLSAAVFWMDYTDLQVQTQVLPENNPYDFDIYYDINAGSARSRGFELSGEALLADRLKFSAAVGYTDAVIEQVVLDGVEYRDQRIPNVRPWTASATLEYRQPLARDREGSVRLDYTWQDDMYWQGVLKDPAYYLPSFKTVDLALGYGPRDGHWAVSAYAENLLDEKYYTSIGWVSVGFRGRMVHIPPRTFGLRFTYRFER